MNEYREHEPEKIDLLNLFQDIWKGMQKFWWLVICLAVALGAKEYFTVSKGYTPQYIASATLAVRSMGSDVEYINEETAEQMAEIFPYIMSSGVLSDAIIEDMGLEYMPGSVSMTVETGTNFFTVSANTNDSQLSYDLLQAALRQYPKVAKFVIGEIEMEVLDETGIPTDTGREYFIRGSVRQGAIKGAAIGLFVMGIYIITRRTVKDRKALRRVINLEDLGSVPRVAIKKRKSKVKNKAVNLNSDRVSQVYLEAIRKLRIKILKEMEKTESKSLLVTSSIPGEGKTTLATNLAIAIARQGKHVILVDCDPRNPSVAECMNEKSTHMGISSVLKGRISVEEALKEVEVTGGKLQVMYGGKPNSRASKLLGTVEMEAVIKLLEDKSDIVILDTAPAGLLADASALARCVDAALYVVKHDYAKKGQIRDGVQALGMSGINVLGFVFNADRNKRSGGYGYGYKRYGYGYGYYGNRKKDEESGRVIKD